MWNNKIWYSVFKVFQNFTPQICCNFSLQDVRNNYISVSCFLLSVHVYFSLFLRENDKILIRRCQIWKSTYCVTWLFKKKKIVCQESLLAVTRFQVWYQLFLCNGGFDARGFVDWCPCTLLLYTNIWVNKLNWDKWGLGSVEENFRWKKKPDEREEKQKTKEKEIKIERVKKKWKRKNIFKKIDQNEIKKLMRNRRKLLWRESGKRNEQKRREYQRTK